LTRDEFVAAREGRWSELERLLDASETRRSGERIRQLAALYRELCADLMQVRSLGFGPDLRRRLDALAARSNNFLYRTPARQGHSAMRSLLLDFPTLVRQEWPFVLVAALLFWLPFGLGTIATLSTTDFAERVLPAEMLEQMSSSYSEGFSQGRSEGQDAAMSGYYVFNNIGIAFRCFATGVLFGTGSIFFLVYNGLVTGTVIGHVASAGYARNILTFVGGHSAFELTAIVISGAAGLRLGYALIDTGGLTRLGSLQKAGKKALGLIFGAAGLLAIAALVEGFWSPSSVREEVKWAVAVLNALLVAGYLALAGRRRKAPAS
jgi:uncharacterized membrane protein SpoIIM required for sporulation